MRGRVARTHTNSVANIMVFVIRNMFDRIGKYPVKKIEVNSLIIKIFVYSAIKIRANRPPLYSVLNPDTNSDSPSAKSNGERFVSARLVMNQKMNIIGIKISGQLIIFIVIIDISIFLWIRRALIKINDIDTSYEIV
jgi:hypothetical protein